MAQTYTVYFGLLAFCLLFAYIAEKTDNKFFVWITIIALSLVAGFRKNTVGLDTINYVSNFTLISNGALDMAFGMEESFKYFCYILLRIWENNNFVLTVLALITNYCILMRFWELRNMSSFVCMVLCYYMSFYFMTMNGMRQFCAVAVTFYSSRFIGQKKYVRFLVGVLLAYIFHQTTLISLIMIIFAYSQWKDLSQKQRLFFIAVTLISPFLIYYVIGLLDRYEKYFLNISLDVGMMLVIKASIFAVALFYVFLLQKKEYFFDRRTLAAYNSFNVTQVSISYVIGICLASLGYIFPFADRIGWYFYIFEGVALGMLLRGRDPLNKLIFGCYIVLTQGYGFIYSIQNNSQGTVPFLFFWQ